MDYPDPLTDWFRRNRHWLALALWVVFLMGGVFDLVTAGVNGVISFAHQAIFGGLLCWLVGSRKDRDQPEFWVRFILGWGLLLVAEAAVVIVATLRDNFEPATLLTLVFITLLLWFSVSSYRRTRKGLTWNRQPANP